MYLPVAAVSLYMLKSFSDWVSPLFHVKFESELKEFFLRWFDAKLLHFICAPIWVRFPLLCSVCNCDTILSFSLDVSLLANNKNKMLMCSHWKVAYGT